MGAVATLGQLALTRAYRTAPTGKIGIYLCLLLGDLRRHYGVAILGRSTTLDNLARQCIYHRGGID